MENNTLPPEHQSVLSRLLALSDPEYRDFQCRLMPTVDRREVLGVRSPALRELARHITAQNEAERFLDSLPHGTYDERNLHAYLINLIRDYDTALARTEEFLPYIDNWATCDVLRPRAFEKNLPALAKSIPEWLVVTRGTYTVRFGIEMLMTYFLGDAFDGSQAELVASVSSDEYYINMMRAWYFATALAKQWENTLPYLLSGQLDIWTHNKTIQKSVESYRISDERKTLLRSLRRK